MPRDYQRKTRRPSNGARPPTDDGPVARGVLLAVEGFCRDRQRTIRSAASVLMEQRAKTNKPVELRRNAAQRVREVLDRLIAASSSAWSAGSVLSLDAIGRHLRRTQSPDEFAKIIACWAVEQKLREYDDGRLTLILAHDPELPRKMFDCSLEWARKLVPKEFVLIPD